MGENLDIITIGEGLVELSSNKSLTYAQTLDKYYGGDTLCTAVAAQRLGSKVGYITRVGTDHFKEFLLDSWQLEGLDISQVKLVEGINGIYFVALPEDGDKEFSFYRKKTAATRLSVDDIAEEYIKSASIVYSTGVTQALSISAREAVKKAFELAKKYNIATAYDPNYDSGLHNIEEAKEELDEIIDFTDILFLNLQYDAQKLFELESPEKIIKHFWDKGVSTVVVKSVKDGGYHVGYAGDINFIGFWSTEIVDSTGSGDAFNGAFIHAMSSGMSAVESTRLASIVAGMQCKGIGAIKSIPYKEQVYSAFYG